MSETNPSSNAASVFYIFIKVVYSFEYQRLDSLVDIFGGLKTMLLCIEFSPFHPIIRPSVCQSVCT